MPFQERCQGTLWEWPAQANTLWVISRQGHFSIHLSDDAYPSWHALHYTRRRLPGRTLAQTSDANWALLKSELIFSSKFLRSPLSWSLWQQPPSCEQHLPTSRALINLSHFQNCLFFLYNISKNRVLLHADVTKAVARFLHFVLQTHGCPQCGSTHGYGKETKSQTNTEHIL